MASGVTLSANRGTEEDEVFGDRSVDDVHAAHCTTGVVKHPLGFDAEVVLVDVRRRLGIRLEIVENIVKDGGGIAGVLCDSGGSDLVDLVVIKDVEVRTNRVESGNQSAKADQKGREQNPAALRARRSAVGALTRARSVGRHVDQDGAEDVKGRAERRSQVKTVR